MLRSSFRASREWIRTIGLETLVACFLCATPLSAQVPGPLAQFDTYIVATHFLRDESYETHHYFKPLRDGVLQGLVFRTAESGATLIEVEWAISQEVFDRLPDWKKEFWHPLAPAVVAGSDRLPGLSDDEVGRIL